jgi:hypothetical protein
MKIAHIWVYPYHWNMKIKNIKNKKNKTKLVGNRSTRASIVIILPYTQSSRGALALYRHKSHRNSFCFVFFLLLLLLYYIIIIIICFILFLFAVLQKPVAVVVSYFIIIHTIRVRVNRELSAETLFGKKKQTLLITNGKPQKTRLLIKYTHTYANRSFVVRLTRR